MLPGTASRMWTCSMRGSEPVDEVDRVAAGGDDVAEVHHDADLVGDPARSVACARSMSKHSRWKCSDSVHNPTPARGRDVAAATSSAATRSRSASSESTGSWLNAPHGSTSARAPVADGQRDEHVQMPGACGAVFWAKRRVEVADVAVDRPHPAARRPTTVPRDVGDCCLVQDVGDVIAHAGQRAEVDLGEAKAGDGCSAPPAAAGDES